MAETSGSVLLVGAAEAAKAIGVSRTKFFELHSAARIPRPIRLGRRCPRWSIDELRAWIAAGAPDRMTWERSKTNHREKSGRAS